MNIFIGFDALRVDTIMRTALQPLQGYSAIFEECIVKGFARQVSHHTDNTDRTMHSGAYAGAQGSSRSGAFSMRSFLDDNVILSNLLLVALPITLLLIVVSLIIL
jgi:hypothetical protein